MITIISKIGNVKRLTRLYQEHKTICLAVKVVDGISEIQGQNIYGKNVYRLNIYRQKVYRTKGLLGQNNYGTKGLLGQNVYETKGLKLEKV